MRLEIPERDATRQHSTRPAERGITPCDGEVARKRACLMGPLTTVDAAKTATICQIRSHFLTIWPIVGNYPSIAGAV